MNYKSYSIWIEAEQWENLWDENDDNTDVIVKFEDGSEWMATFFTYENILSASKRNEETGEFLYGNYFWASEMILVKKITRFDIEEVVKNLLSDGTFERVFKQCEL